MIKGEALAARAWLHFDLLRMFAPAPSSNPSGLYIPYVKEFPYYGGQTPLTVEETMEAIEVDLKAAQEMIMAYDTLDLAHRAILKGIFQLPCPEMMVLPWRCCRSIIIAVIELMLWL